MASRAYIRANAENRMEIPKIIGRVEGRRVWRTISNQGLLLREHFTTPPQELELEEGERARFVPVDSRALVPSLIVPGDLVVFLVPKMLTPQPTPAVPAEATNDPLLQPLPSLGGAYASGSIERMGPFKLLAIGNRLGSDPVHRRVGGSRPAQENVIVISVTDENEKKADKLLSMLQATNSRGVWVELYDQKGRKKRMGKP